MEDSKILAGIDACRPDSQDVHSPELAEVAEQLRDEPHALAMYERVQRLDRQLVAAFAEVTLPADLAARLLARLGQVQPRQEASTATQSAVESVATPKGEIATASETVPACDVTLAASAADADSRRSTRRRWLIGWSVAASLFLSAVLGWSVWPVGKTLDAVARGELCYDRLASAWQPLDKAPSGFRFPTSLQVRPRCWQRIELNAVAYDLSSGKDRAVLLVFREKMPGLPAAPPNVPQSSTGGRAIAAWTSGGLTYVLVAPGDERHYRSLINVPGPGNLG